VHHYNSTQYCNTETVFIYIPLPPESRVASFSERCWASHVSVRHTDGGGGLSNRPFGPHWLVHPVFHCHCFCRYNWNMSWAVHDRTYSLAIYYIRCTFRRRLHYVWSGSEAGLGDSKTTACTAQRPTTQTSSLGTSPTAINETFVQSTSAGPSDPDPAPPGPVPPGRLRAQLISDDSLLLGKWWPSLEPGNQ